MKILYIVYFKAPMGGLHENVYATANYMKKQGHDITVVLKPGLLEERLQLQNINTISTTFEDINDSIETITSSGTDYNLIHFHPGKSKDVALSFGEKYQIPMIVTFHGMFHDNINNYIDNLKAVVTVSEGIRDNLFRFTTKGKEKFKVIPNGYNSDIYGTPSFSKPQNVLKFSIVTRFDKDKVFILEIIEIFVKYICTIYNVKVEFILMGEGSLKEEFKNKLYHYIDNSIHHLTDRGWLTDDDLVDGYVNSDIVLAPGRSAIEAMSLGKCVIAVGSKYYIGLINQESWQKAVYTNFGGIGNKMEDYTEGQIESEIDLLFSNDDIIYKHGVFAYKLTSQLYDDKKINHDLMDFYSLLISSNEL